MTKIPFSLGEHVRKSKAVRQITALGIASVGLLVSMSSPASADVGGVWMKGSHPFTIRAQASASSAKIATITDRNVQVPCLTAGGGDCIRQEPGGSYRCWSGGPSGNAWLKVRWAGKNGWVADACVDVGRIG
ncbi:hypothetical protein [Streptomyces yokosukanensis]|uniref:hypothetical protein n=1 Tax=Streptomyces yokosukanensis TaxID=67386 RepID=UPI000B00021F|nr:hypothetical protein [Streptomyces yokosukanensis]